VVHLLDVIVTTVGFYQSSLKFYIFPLGEEQMAISKTQVSQLYVSIFGRASEGEGNTFWQTQATTTSAADLMFQQQVVKDYFNVTDFTSEANVRTVVETIYLNALGKTPTDDPTGIQFWIDSVIVNGDSMGTMAAALTFAATQPINAGPAQDAFNNKVAVSDHTADTIPAFTNFAQFQAYIASVDSTQASVDAAIASVDADAPLTFSLTSDAPNGQVHESVAATYTVTASAPVTQDTDVVFNVVVGDSTAADQQTNNTNFNDFVSGTFNPVTVTILAGETTATYAVTGASDGLTELPEAYSVTADVAGTTLSATTSLLDGGSTFVLTTGIDTVTGTSFNDVIQGTLQATGSTLTALDNIDGGAGIDILNLDVLPGAPAAPTSTITVANVEIANIQSADNAALLLNTSSWSGLTNLNVQSAVNDVTLTAASTTAVNVDSIINSDADIAVTGGSAVTVTTKLDNDADSITVNGAGDVTVTASDVKTSSINLGVVPGAANTGVISVTSTGAALTAGAAIDTMAAINATGGTTMSVTQSASSNNAAAATDTSNATITQGAVTLTGGDTTTEMTVIQDKAVTATNAVAAVAAVHGTNVVTFVNMAAGETVTINGLTFTAAKALTAAEAAAAFANLTTNDLQAAGGPSVNGIYTATSNGGFTSGAVVGDTVTFTEAVAGSGAVMSIGDTAVAGNISGAAGITGVTAVSGVTGVSGVVAGQVTLADGGTDSLTTVSVDAYGAGSTLTSNALTDLSLANSGNASMTVATTATALNLALNNVEGSLDLDVGGATVESLNLAVSTKGSTGDLKANAVTNLNISGDTSANLSGSAFNALQTVVVSGSASATFDANVADTVTSVNTTATSGTVTTTIGTDTATYTGGAGVDNVTSDSSTVNKAIALGAGDDSMTLATGTSVIAATGSIDGGAGTADTLSMATADAVTASGSTAFATKVTNFERVTLTGATGNQTVDVAKLGAYNDVTVAGSSTAASLVIDQLASAGTVTITGDMATAAGDELTVQVTDAATANVSLNLGVSGAASIGAGTVVAASVETISIESNDTVTTGSTVPVHTMTLQATAATSLTLTGNAALTLTNTGNTALTTVDASAMTQALTFTAAGTVAEVITGGAGDDVLTASTAGDTLMGGAGNDTLVAGNLAQLTGGAGADTFDMTTVTSNLNAYASILDASSGDVIKANAGAFIATDIALGSTAIFQDFANAAVNSTSTNNDIAWFQFAGNTYVLQDANTGGSAYDASVDTIIQISGLVDLSTASFNATQGTIEIA